MNEYLNEKRLGLFLTSIFTDVEIISNKKVDESVLPFRPDFRIPKLKMIVEFDGFRHYNETKLILKDKTKDL